MRLHFDMLNTFTTNREYITSVKKQINNAIVYNKLFLKNHIYFHAK